MGTRTDRSLGARVGIVCGLALVAWCFLAGPVRAQVAPPPPQEEADDDPPRKDVRMGNTGNMRMGRAAAGNILMEVRPPKKNPEYQPQVGPFFIYPQVGTPWSQGGGQGTGQPRPPSPSTRTGS